MLDAELLSIEHPICFRIRVSGDIWRLILDDSDGRGFVSITGFSWSGAYFWSRVNRGRQLSLLEFLVGIDIGYAAGKFGAAGWFDSDATERQAREWLNRQDRPAGFDEALLDPSFSSQSEWEDWVRALSAEGIREAWESGIVTGIRPDFRDFYEAAWPLLRARRSELDQLVNEAPGAAHA